MFTKSEYAEYILEQLPRFVEGFVVAKPTKLNEDKDPLHFDVYYEIDNNKNCIFMNLNSNWEQYVNSGGKSSILISVLDSVSQMVKQSVEMMKFNIAENKESIFPTVRHMFWLQEQMNSVPSEIPHLSLPVADLVTLFYFDYEKYSMGVNSFMYRDGFGKDEVIEQAFKNVEKKGWVNDRHKIDLKSGKVLIFEENDPFNYQFFNTGWVEEHLGDNFYFSLPNRHEAVVYIPSKTHRTKDFLNDRNNFIQDTASRYARTPALSLSSSIYSYRKGDYGTIPFGR